jgi:hypothetical protein
VLGVAISLPAASATLIHAYDFQGNVNDLVGSENGTLVGGATASGGVLTLNGVDGYVQFASHLIPSGSYSVRFSAAGPTAWDNYFEMISQGGDYGWYIGGDPNNGHIRASDAWSDIGLAFPTDGRQHQYGLVVDAGANTSKLFIDWILRASVPYALTVSTTTGTDTRLGRQYGGWGEYLDGTMGGLQIYSGALSDSEMVPEPSALLLAAGGLCLLGIRRLSHLRPR